MADNVAITAGTGTNIACDEATYSGDTTKIQLTRLVHVSGAEGAKTVSEIVGTAGSPGTAVVTVQGVASGTVIPVSDGGGSLTVDGTVTANLAAGTNNIGDVDVLSVVPGTGATNQGKAIDSVAGATDTGVAALAVRDDALTTLTPADGDYVPLRTTSTGALWVANAGASSIFTDDAAFTPATSSVAVVGAQADDTATDSVDEGDAGALRMTLDRKLYTTPAPHTTGGLSIFRSLDIDETEEDVKTSAGQVYACWVTNTATATRFVKFYNATAANVTVGTTTPVITVGIPGNSSDDIAGHFTAGGFGIVFDTAICVAATTGVADNDTGAPGANDVIINVFYK